MNQSNMGLLSDLKILALFLLINICLCLLLIYKVKSISVASEEQIATVKDATQKVSTREEWLSLGNKMADAIEEHEEKKASLKQIVLRFSAGMVATFVLTFATVIRILLKARHQECSPD